MSSKNKQRLIIVGVSLFVLIGVALAARDKDKVDVPTGVSFSEFEGYEDGQNASASQTEEGIKAVPANPMMVDTLWHGISGNGKPLPETSMLAKIEWTREMNLGSRYSVEIPGTFETVSFLENDSQAFLGRVGWGHAEFLNNATSAQLTPFGTDIPLGTKVHYLCHTLVKNKDYICTAYPLR
jgi:hypothetical protein